MITSKPFANRSNAFRAAKVAVEKSGGALSLNSVKVTLGQAGYVYTIAEASGAANELVAEKTPAEPASDAASAAIDDHAAEVAAEASSDQCPSTEVAEAAPEAVEEDPVTEAGVVDFGSQRAADDAAFDVLSTLHTEQDVIVAANAAAAQEAAEAAALAASAPPEIVTGEVLLCIAFPASGAHMWAGQLAKKTKMQVTIRDGVTFEVKQVVDSRVGKAARAKSAGGPAKPRVGGAADKMVALMSQPGGATVSALREAAGWNTNPSSFYARKIAAARGMMLVLGKKGKEQTFALVEGVKNAA